MSETDLAPEGVEDAPASAEEQTPIPENREPDVVESVAEAMGWAPKDKWHGPDDQWEDAASFLKRTPKVLDGLREQMKRTSRATERLIADSKRKAQREAEERIRQAVEMNDPEAALAAARTVQGADNPAQEWAESRPWFQTDDAARAVAIAAANRVASNGGTPEEQLEEAERAVRRRFPEYFEETKPNGVKAGHKAPVVAGGQRSSAAPRDKGWADLPPGIRSDPALKRMIAKGDFTEAEYAKQYYEDNA